MDYDKMLDRLYLSLPKKTKDSERFEMPEVHSFIQGNKTFIKNFNQFFKLLPREEKHFFKFLTKEVATSVSKDKEMVVLNTKVPGMQVTKLVHAYIKQFVLCPECGKPDTKFMEHKGVKMLRCEACGALSPVKRL